MKRAVFWIVTPCGSCLNRRIGEAYLSTIRVERISELGTTLAITSNVLIIAIVVPSSLILFTLMMDAEFFNSTPVLELRNSRLPNYYAQYSFP
jgi:hypothetical protein